mgnify:CR=1 FL=1
MHNVLFIEGGAYNDVRKALLQWIDLYSETLEEDFVFELYKNGRGKHIMVADERLKNEQFNYLVNYITYPEDITYKVEVKGYTNVSEPTVFPSEFLGQEIELFIPSTDNEFDNVYWITKENKVYKTDFGAKTTDSSISKNYENFLFDPLKLQSPEFFSSKKPVTDPLREFAEQNSNEKSIALRFKIISSLFAILVFVSYLLEMDRSKVVNLDIIIGFGMAVWFIVDYKMLQLNRYNLYCFFVAALLFLYGFIVRNYDDHTMEKAPIFVLSMPLSCILIQRPLRLIFIRTLKREPVIEKPMPTLADGLYGLILLMSSVLLSNFIEQIL